MKVRIALSAALARCSLGGDTLEVDFVFGKGVFECLGTFVVQDVEGGRVTLFKEKLVGGLPSITDAGGLAVRDGNSVDRVSVVCK